MKLKKISLSLLMLTAMPSMAQVPQNKISFVVWLKLRNQPALMRLAEEVYDIKSPRYHQFLTQARLEKEFAPYKQIELAVQRIFLTSGMHAEIINHHIRVTGTAAQVERALHVKLNEKALTKPRLNPQLDAYVSEITGLLVKPQPKMKHVNEGHHSEKIHPLNFAWKGQVPYAMPTDLSLQGFSGANLQKTYSLGNIPKISGTRIDGSGQTLVIVDKCGTNGPDQILKDSNIYFKQNNITPFVTSGPAKNFAVANPDGSKYTSCSSASSYSQEIMLDVESSHTIATGDNTVIILGDDQKTLLMEVISTLTANAFTIAGFPNAYVISNSWSGPENGYDNQLETSLALAAASGISVNFSSGDCGDNTYSTSGKCSGTWPSSPKVDYPSSSAFVTAVGATALFVDSQYRYAFETVWGGVRDLAYKGGTGGGISLQYGPVSWQASITPFSAGGYGPISSFSNKRALPDIAMLGDPKTGLLIYSNNSQVQDGGTSLACPLFSATLVLINQARLLLNKNTPIGQAAPYLYQMNHDLLLAHALNLIVPPAVIISGATPPPSGVIQGNTAPSSSFTIHNDTYGWDSSLTVEPENQFWNDGVGVGSPNIPNFVIAMANF